MTTQQQSSDTDRKASTKNKAKGKQQTDWWTRVLAVLAIVLSIPAAWGSATQWSAANELAVAKDEAIAEMELLIKRHGADDLTAAAALAQAASPAEAYLKALADHAEAAEALGFLVLPPEGELSKFIVDSDSGRVVDFRVGGTGVQALTIPGGASASVNGLEATVVSGFQRNLGSTAELTVQVSNFTSKNLLLIQAWFVKKSEEKFIADSDSRIQCDTPDFLDVSTLAQIACHADDRAGWLVLGYGENASVAEYSEVLWLDINLSKSKGQ